MIWGIGIEGHRHDIGMQSDKNLITLHAAARRFRIPWDWLLAESEAGRLPHLNADGTILFAVDALKNALLNLASEAAEIAGDDQEGGGA